MHNWQNYDARRELEALHTLVTADSLQSDVPRYVLESIAGNVRELIRSEINPNEVRALVLGAIRTSADAGASLGDDDPVAKQLRKLEAILPVEK